MIGVIVAGGGSTRFGGEPKGLRTVEGVRIIDRVATALRGAFDRLILVSNAPDAEDWLPDASVIRDVRPERGSLIGIHTALSAARDDVLIAAWDMPFLNAPLIGMIHARLSPAVFAAIPETSTGLEPFCAAYSLRCLPLIESAIVAGELRVSALIDRLPVVRRIGPSELREAGDPDRMFFNVNTAEDLAAAERMARGD